MGNNPSKSPTEEESSHPGSAHYGAAGAANKGVIRKPSVHTLPGRKAAAVDPAATRETATGQPSQTHRTPVQKHLQSRTAADAPNLRAVERPEKRDARGIIDPRHSSSATPPPPDSSHPVQVPSGRAHADRDLLAPSGPPLNTYYGASAHLQRPPRLPLPIGDATATPGSPIIGPADAQVGDVPLDRLLDEQLDLDNAYLSSTTVDEDEVVDEFQPYAIGGVNRAVPMYIEWTGPGQKVYVTGTFVNWEKKFRLHKDESGVLSTTLNLRPGTHHLKFIVDGDMRASDTLPTAVDFTNHLVNYVEVSADDMNRGRRESERGSRVAVPPGVHPPQVLPDAAASEQLGDSMEDEEQKEEPDEEIPLGDFRGIIPQFLADLDNDEDSAEYQQAASIIGDTPAPPSLPLFLGKSILNGTTPMKDDSSVLNYPNHTVLNHLATSSIKNGVLATSVTTRYKRKYVTTILYKPTNDIAD